VGIREPCVPNVTWKDEKRLASTVQYGQIEPAQTILISNHINLNTPVVSDNKAHHGKWASTRKRKRHGVVR
jgi:hypothetical protein